MISRDCRTYDFYRYSTTNSYNQPVLSKEVEGTIKIAINTVTTSIVDSVKYKNAQYIGLTQDPIDDTFVIAYEGEKLKVLYVNPKGRYKQVFMVAL